MVKGQLRNAENARIICEGLASGLSLNRVAQEIGISDSSVYEWMAADSDFAEKYARARQTGYAVMADQLVDISDSVEGDPARDRLRVDTRKWMLSKMLPKVYGERLAVDITKIAEEFENTESATLAKIAGVELPNNRNESA